MAGDNIIFRCAFMGLSFKEAWDLCTRRSPNSVSWEISSNMPVRTYSSGMFVRLAFAIPTSIEPDIVIMDEMINAGDAQFIAKARARIEKILGNASIFADCLA